MNVTLMYETLIKANYTFNLWHLFVIFFNTNKDYICTLKEDYKLSCLNILHQLRNILYTGKCIYLKF